MNDRTSYIDRHGVRRCSGCTHPTHAAGECREVASFVLTPCACDFSQVPTTASAAVEIQRLDPAPAPQARCRVCGVTAPADGILERVAHEMAMEDDPEHRRFLAADRRSRAVPASGPVRPRAYEDVR